MPLAFFYGTLLVVPLVNLLDYDYRTFELLPNFQYFKQYYNEQSYLHTFEQHS